MTIIIGKEYIGKITRNNKALKIADMVITNVTYDPIIVSN